MASLVESPSANRIHIGVFGKTNAGKSSLINAFANQKISIVSTVSGTTTDPVRKSMEIYPLGPCVLIDTAGFDDSTVLAEKRSEKTRIVESESDIAIIVIAADEHIDNLSLEIKLFNEFKENNTPVLFVINKIDLDTENGLKLEKYIKEKLSDKVISVSCDNGSGIENIKKELSLIAPDEEKRFITGNIVGEDDIVLLVMPQDIQAPKGRLILPQVQTIRELLDKKCLVLSVTTDKLISMLNVLNKTPKLIITDSQAFDFVYENKPEASMLTSFSVLFASLKGDLDYYIEGAKSIEKLNENSKVLIAECCTHAPLSEDIGREKIPALLRKRIGNELKIDVVSGTDFPKNLDEYDLIIQCGGCMFNRKYVMSRILQAKESKVAMSNYGIVIAYLKGILDKITT